MSEPAVKPEPRRIIYRIEVRASQALRDDGDECEDYPTLEWAVSQQARTELERAVFTCLKRLDADCDCEVMDWTVEEDV